MVSLESCASCHSAVVHLSGLLFTADEFIDAVWSSISRRPFQNQILYRKWILLPISLPVIDVVPKHPINLIEERFLTHCFDADSLSNILVILSGNHREWLDRPLEEAHLVTYSKVLKRLEIAIHWFACIEVG